VSDEQLLARVRAHTRRRLAFSLLVLLGYFSFVLNWLPVGQGLTRRLGDSHLTGSLAMFMLLIVAFILLECLFLWRQRRRTGSDA
jgi:hypothetical protein